LTQPFQVLRKVFRAYAKFPGIQVRFRDTVIHQYQELIQARLG